MDQQTVNTLEEIDKIFDDLSAKVLNTCRECKKLVEDAKKGN